MIKDHLLKIIIFVCISLCTIVNIGAQGNIYKAISEAEKTVFSITTYNKGGGKIGKSAGFFISSQGLAVCQASLFIGADSISINDPRNLNLTIERIVSTHQASDLAIVKIESSIKNRFDFLFPTTSLFREEEELLIFSDPDLKSDGAVIEKITKVIDKPFLNRLGILSSYLSSKAYAAPVINGKGELVGIVGNYKEQAPSFIFNCATLSDTSWISFNITPKKLKESALKQAYLASSLSKALVCLSFDDWIGSAKYLTSYLKVFNNSAMGFAMRGYTRYMYNNKEESKHDFATARQISAHSYLVYYFQCLVAINENKKERAYSLADSSVYYQPKFPQTRILRGDLGLETNKPTNDALLDYSYAIQANPNYAEAYYRRCLYLRKYTKNFDLAYSDITQCIMLDPSIGNAYFLKSQMNIENENFFEAQKNLNKAVQKNPANEEMLFTRAIVNYHLGLRTEACQDWKKASDLGDQKAMSYLLKYCNQSTH